MKIIIFLILIAVSGTLSVGTLMPEIGWFDLTKVEVLHGKAEIAQAGWSFICECVPMPDPNNPDTNGDFIPDCGAANLNCEARPCTDDITMLPNDFCSACSASGAQCDPAPYFESAEMCNVVTTCP